jgi:hypothetical protein
MRLALPNGRRGRGLVIAAGAAAVVAAACSDVPSDPQTPFAIEFNRAASPSVVLGEQMFDSLGVTAPLKARVFNSKGEEIVGADVTYHVVSYTNVDSTNPAFADSVPLTVDAASGIVTGKSAPVYATKTARVYAQAGKLQSQTVTITATRHPDLLVPGGPLEDSLMISFLNTDSLLLAPATPFTVRVRHTTGALTAADSTVPAYLVRFRIVYPANAATDTSYVMLTNGDRKRSQLDTTDASGNASRQVRIRRVNFPFGKAAGADNIVRDTILVEASAYREGGAAVAGSPITFRLIVKANKQ